MAEKKLVMEFSTSGGQTTSMTLSGAKQDLDSVTTKGAMQSMVDAACFATEKGAAYTAPLRAYYEETTETKIWDFEDEQA